MANITFSNSTITATKAELNVLTNIIGDDTSGLVKDVANAGTNITTLTTTIGDDTSGLVKDVANAGTNIATLTTTIGDDTSGLVKDVANAGTNIAALQAIPKYRGNGTADNIKALDKANYILGDTVFNTDDNKTYTFNGTDWYDPTGTVIA